MLNCALIFTAVLIGFLIVIFFVTPNLTPGQAAMLRLIYPLTGGFAAFFISGTASLKVSGSIPGSVKIAFSATAGIAVFIFLYLFPPKALDPAPEATKVLVIDSYVRRYDQSSHLTNAHYLTEFAESLRSVLNKSITAEHILVDSSYDQLNYVVEKSPDLVIIHLSSFFDSTNETVDPKAFRGSMQKFQTFTKFLLENLPKVKILVYTREIPGENPAPGDWSEAVHTLLLDNLAEQKRFIEERKDVSAR